MTQPLGGGGLRGSLAEPGSGLSHRALLSPAASLSTQGVDVEHTAALQGVRYAHSLQQGASDYYRALTPALEMLVRGTGEQGGGYGGGRTPGAVRAGRGSLGPCTGECVEGGVPERADSCRACGPRLEAKQCLPAEK